MSVLEDRRQESRRRLKGLIENLQNSALVLPEDACVYATGSYGRDEAHAHSDLDPYMIGRTQTSCIFKKFKRKKILGVLKKVARDSGLPKFDRGGKFLGPYSSDELIGNLGHPQDDDSQTFTARLLLLLESQPMLGENFYDEVIEQAIDAYWRDYVGHEENFIPAYLINDILRLWRTFCVNYEAFTKSEPEKERAKRLLKNYKLRHSRLLTCYSAIAHILELHRKRGTASPKDILHMVQLTPLERLERLVDSPCREHARNSLDLYTNFLVKTDASEETLHKHFLDPAKRREFRASEKDFGDAIYKLLRAINPDTRSDGYLFRLLVV